MPAFDRCSTHTISFDTALGCPICLLATTVQSYVTHVTMLEQKVAALQVAHDKLRQVQDDMTASLGAKR